MVVCAAVVHVWRAYPACKICPGENDKHSAVNEKMDIYIIHHLDVWSKLFQHSTDSVRMHDNGCPSVRNTGEEN